MRDTLPHEPPPKAGVMSKCSPVNVIASQIGSRFGTAARPSFSHRVEEKSVGKQPIERMIDVMADVVADSSNLTPFIALLWLLL